MRLAVISLGVLLSAGPLFAPHGLAATVEGGPSAPAVCAAPLSLIVDDTPLGHLHAALLAGGTLDVLAVGSGSMLGEMPDGPETAFPYRMRDVLQASWPGVDIRLHVLAGRGVTAAEMLTDITRELAHAHYPLVLWQTGTVEAMRGVPSDEFYRTLSAGAAAVREAGGDLVLIDTPYNRVLRRRADIAPYEGALARASQLDSVAIFRRHELMRFWADAGRLDLERAPKADRGGTITTLHTCLGTALAQMLERGADLTKR